MRLRHLAALSIALTACLSQANAATIDWTTWSSNAAGSIVTTGGPVGVTFAGEMSGLATNYPSWTPSATWADGSVVANGPSQMGGMVRLLGGGGREAGIDTLTFAQAVVNPVIAIWSLGSGNAQARFDFIGATPVLVAGGPSAEYGGSGLSIIGNSVLGSEGNGTIEFIGTFTSLSWTNPAYENYYGFTVGTSGLPPIPEPDTYLLLAGGLTALAFLGRRRKL